MGKFRDAKTLQKFADVFYASIHNRSPGIFNQDRHLNRHDTFKQMRSAALAGWRQLMEWTTPHGFAISHTGER